MKKCTKCQIEKEVTEFNIDNSRRDGLQAHCNLCRKAYRKADAERINNRSKKYYNDNKEYVIKRVTERYKKQDGGIYFLKDFNGNLMYIGQSTNLKQRYIQFNCMYNGTTKNGYKGKAKEYLLNENNLKLTFEVQQIINDDDFRLEVETELISYYQPELNTLLI
tara:strand:- start:31336 stop:31827 length:492 start_codon:yes stop_codon:yes gene_type:complete